MKDSDNDLPGSDIASSSSSSSRGLHGQKPALHVICLGNSGGPCEEDVTGFLVRSTERHWERGSLLAVDAGSHLAPICRILERDFPSVSAGPPDGRTVSNGSLAGMGNGYAVQMSREVTGASLSPSPETEEEEVRRPEPTVLKSGPFAGLKLPNASARANAAYILRSYISTYLITHPHLDHLSGFVINTAAFHATSRPKTLAALPSTVDAVRQHIFNDVIWPNLTDEDGGVGFVTFQRLKEGGDVMVGEGEGRGYIDVIDGLGVRAFKISHGLCAKTPSNHHRGSIPGGPGESQLQLNGDTAPAMGRSLSTSQHHSTPGTPGMPPRQSFNVNQPSPRMLPMDTSCVVDSTAFFIRSSGREILIFGDVEPDSISLAPRNHVVWQEAARKIAQGLLGGIFIECSYDDSQPDAVLFGHLCPRHLIAELQTLAGLVGEAKVQRALERSVKKRKRSGLLNGGGEKHAGLSQEYEEKRSRSLAGRAPPMDSRRGSSVPEGSLTDVEMATSPSVEQPNPMEYNNNTSTDDNATSNSRAPPAHHRGAMSPRSASLGHPAHASVGLVRHTSRDDNKLPLFGIKVVVIHIKDTMKDGPHISETILAELRAHERGLADEGRGLGCEFVVSRSGESYWF